MIRLSSRLGRRIPSRYPGKARTTALFPSLARGGTQQIDRAECLEIGRPESHRESGRSPSIQLTGSLATYLTAIAVARNIAGAEMVAGRRCVVAFFGDGTDPMNAAVISVWA